MSIVLWKQLNVARSSLCSIYNNVRERSPLNVVFSSVFMGQSLAKFTVKNMAIFHSKLIPERQIRISGWFFIYIIDVKSFIRFVGPSLLVVRNLYDRTFFVCWNGSDIGNGQRQFLLARIRLAYFAVLIKICGGSGLFQSF